MAQSRPQKLVVGLMPGESAPTAMRLNEPLRAYLEKRLGIPVELVIGANCAATGEALRCIAGTVLGAAAALPLSALSAGLARQ